MTKEEQIKALRKEESKIDVSLSIVYKKIDTIRKNIHRRLCNILFKDYLPETEWKPSISGNFKPCFDAVNPERFESFCQIWSNWEHDSLIMGKISFIVEDGDITLQFVSIEYGLRIAKSLRLKLDCTSFEEKVIKLRDEANALDDYLRRISDGLSRGKDEDS